MNLERSRRLRSTQTAVNRVYPEIVSILIKKKKESISKIPWQQPTNRFLALSCYWASSFAAMSHCRATRSCTVSDYTFQAATETHNPTHIRKKEKKGLLVTLGLILEQTQAACSTRTWKHSSLKCLHAAPVKFLGGQEDGESNCFSSVCRPPLNMRTAD